MKRKEEKIGRRLRRFYMGGQCPGNSRGFLLVPRDLTFFPSLLRQEAENPGKIRAEAIIRRSRRNPSATLSKPLYHHHELDISSVMPLFPVCEISLVFLLPEEHLRISNGGKCKSPN